MVDSTLSCYGSFRSTMRYKIYAVIKGRTKDEGEKLRKYGISIGT